MSHLNLMNQNTISLLKVKLNGTEKILAKLICIIMVKIFLLSSTAECCI